MSDVEQLSELMDADRWVERVRAQHENLPEIAELVNVENELRAMATHLESVEAVRHPTRDRFNEAADRAHSLRERRDDLERRLHAATAPARELTAMQGELDHLTTALSSAEDAEVTLLLELEPLDDEVEQVRTRAQPLAVHRRELQGAIKELQLSLDDELASRRAIRTMLISKLAPELRKSYERAMSRSGISGAARIEGSRCDGCRIALAPLDIDRVRSAREGEFVECPSCGRLLLP